MKNAKALPSKKAGEARGS